MSQGTLRRWDETGELLNSSRAWRPPSSSDSPLSHQASEGSEGKLHSGRVLSPKDPEWLQLKSAMWCPSPPRCVGVSSGGMGVIPLSCWGLRRGGSGCDRVQYLLSLLG